MVRLAILPHRGNQNRAFPYTGYLGLTPVSVQGYVRTELEEDNLSLEASHVQVRLRCYECEGRGTHTAKSSNVRVLYEVSKRLWAASAGQEHGALGDFEAKFRLTVPVDATLHGALSSMHFKTWRIWWALEAVVHHTPSATFGSRLMKASPLHLVSFAYPPPARHLAWDNMISATVPLLRFSAETDSDHYGPGQPFSLTLKLQRTELDPALQIKRLIVELHREVLVETIPSKAHSTDSTPSDDSDAPRTPCDELPPYLDTPDQSLLPPSMAWPSLPSGLPSPSDSYSRKTTDSSYFPAAPPASMEDSTPSLVPAASRIRKEDAVLMSRVLQAPEVQFSAQGEWSGSITNAIPRSKTVYHWSIGETCATSSITVRFYVVVKIAVKSKLASLIELPPREVTFQSIAAEERAIARDQVGKIFAIQTAETRMFDRDPTLPRRSTSTGSAAMSMTSASVPPIVPAEPIELSPRVSMESRPSIDSVVSEDPLSGDSQRRGRARKRFGSAVLSFASRLSFDGKAGEGLPQARRASVQAEQYAFLGLSQQRTFIHPAHRRTSSSIAVHFTSNPTTPTSEVAPVGGIPVVDPFANYNLSAFALQPRSDAQPVTIEGGRVVPSKRKHARRSSRAAGVGPTDIPADPLVPSPESMPRLAPLEAASTLLSKRSSATEDGRRFGFLRRGSRI